MEKRFLILKYEHRIGNNLVIDVGRAFHKENPFWN